MTIHNIGSDIVVQLSFDTKWALLKPQYEGKFFSGEANGPLIQTTGDIVNDEALTEIKQFLATKIECVSGKEVSPHDVTFIVGWINKYTKNSHISLHDHFNTDYSCVIYLEVDENDPSSALLFRNNTTKEFYSVKVKPDDVLIFGGGLAHKSLPNESDKDRYIMGLNVKINKQVNII